MRFLVATLAGPLLAVGLLAGCGSTGAQPAVSASPVSGQLSETDSGKTLSMKVGDTVELALHQRPGANQWSNVRSSDTAVLAPQVDTRATAVRGVTLAKFKAVAAGRADITATATADCSPGSACPAIAQVWRVTILVRA